MAMPTRAAPTIHERWSPVALQTALSADLPDSRPSHAIATFAAAKINIGKNAPSTKLRDKRLWAFSRTEPSMAPTSNELPQLPRVLWAKPVHGNFVREIDVPRVLGALPDADPHSEPFDVRLALRHDRHNIFRDCRNSEHRIADP